MKENKINEGEVLYTYDSSEFRNRRVVVKLVEDATYLVIPEGPSFEPHDFGTLQGFRKEAKTAKEMYDGAISDMGHVVANVGVSGLISMTFDGKDYALLVLNERTDRANPDFVAKLISGYWDFSKHDNPRRVILTEISEEILPFVKSSKGPRLLKFLKDGEVLPNPFEDNFNGYSLRANIQTGSRLSLPRGIDERVYLDSREIPDTPILHLDAPVNGGQLVFPYHIDELAGVVDSIYHSEDSFNAGLMEVKIFGDKLLMIKLDDSGNMTDELFGVRDGLAKKLDHVDPRDVNLSEAFAPREHGLVVAQASVNLMDYLKNQ